MSDLPLTPEKPPIKYSGSADLMLGDKVWHSDFASYQIHRDPITNSLSWDGVIFISALLPDDPQAIYRIVFDNGASGEIPLLGIATTGHPQKLPFKGHGNPAMPPKKPKRRVPKVRPTR